MKQLVALILVWTAPALNAETIGQSGAPINYLKAKAELRPASLPKSSRRDLPVVSATGRLKNKLEKSSVCRTSIFQQENHSMAFDFAIMPKDSDFLSLPTDIRLGVGEAVPLDQYPLRRGDIEVWAQRLNVYPTQVTFDGSVLRFARGQRVIEGKPIITVYEFHIDSGMNRVSEVRYREFEGTELSNAVQTDTQVLCQALIG